LKDQLVPQRPATRRLLERTGRPRRDSSGLDALNAAIRQTVIDGIVVLDGANTITDFNPAAERMFGRPRADALGRPVGDVLQPSASAGVPLGLFAAAGAGCRFEMTARRADGRPFPVEVSLAKIGGQGATQVAAVVREIGGRKAHEAAVHERDRLSDFAGEVAIAFTQPVSLSATLAVCARLMSAHLEAALVRIWTRRPGDDRFQVMASAGHLASRACPDEPPSPGCFALDDIVRERRTIVTHAIADDVRADRGWAMANGVVSFVGHPLIIGDRVVGVISMFGHRPFSNAALQAIAYIAIAVASAIERDRVEASRARLAAIIEATPDLVAITELEDPASRYLNPAGRTMLGIGPEDPLLALSAYRPAAFLAELREVILSAALEDGLWRGETTFVSRDGRVIPVSEVTIAHALPGGRVQVSTIARDITDRRESAAELRASDERTRFALESAGMGVWELDLRTRRITWTGMKALDGGRLPQHFAGDEEAFFAATHVDDREMVRQAIERAIAERDDLAVAFRTVGRSGGTRWVECRGRVLCETETTPARIVGVSTDVTQRKLLEAQLRQSQKMEAIGQLAGGVAHDFNNLLTAILGYATFAAESLPPDDQRRHDVDEVIKAAQRAAALTKQLLAFSRTQVLKSTVVDLNVLVAGIADMLRRLIGDHIALDLVPGSALAPVRADAGQLEQVVMNLVVNARDAMDQGGRLTIETANIHLDAASGPPHLTVIPGWYVMVAVADDGIGMDEHTKRHLFEPFFTTKEHGKGTGLGLATVYGIVTQSDGYIWVDSEQGRGSTFRMYLPRTERDTAAVPQHAAPACRHEGSETVLLVEDEAGVRGLAHRMLEREGYCVLDAANGREAQGIFARHPGSIDLLITDVVMPGLSGPDLFRGLAVEQPGLKVIYMSGYASEAMARRLQLDRGQPHLQKPFTAGQLASRVRSVLDAPLEPPAKNRP
jgi:two-component system, cell cycle sensor histidine kinase and response regulator CckA